MRKFGRRGFLGSIIAIPATIRYSNGTTAPIHVYTKDTADKKNLHLSMLLDDKWVTGPKVNQVTWNDCIEEGTYKGQCGWIVKTEGMILDVSDSNIHKISSFRLYDKDSILLSEKALSTSVEYGSSLVAYSLEVTFTLTMGRLGNGTFQRYGIALLDASLQYDRPKPLPKV